MAVSYTHLIPWATDGYTPGKWVCRIRITGRNERKPALYQYALRSGLLYFVLIPLPIIWFCGYIFDVCTGYREKPRLLPVSYTHLDVYKRQPFIVVGAVIMAFTISVRLSVIFLIAVPLLALVIYAVMAAGIPVYRRVQNKLDLSLIHI